MAAAAVDRDNISKLHSMFTYVSLLKFHLFEGTANIWTVVDGIDAEWSNTRLIFKRLPRSARDTILKKRELLLSPR